jgi:hypothetical protein
MITAITPMDYPEGDWVPGLAAEHLDAALGRVPSTPDSVAINRHLSILILMRRRSRHRVPELGGVQSAVRVAA